MPSSISSPKNPPVHRDNRRLGLRVGCQISKRSTISATPLSSNPSYANPGSEDGFHRDYFDIDTGSPDSDLSRRAHQPVYAPAASPPSPSDATAAPLRARCTTSERGRTITVDQHHDRRAANKARWAKDETQHHLPELPAARRTDHRLAHPPQSQTRPLPRANPQPTMAHHPNRGHQPTTPHQPRTRPHPHRLGTQPHLNHQTRTPNPKTRPPPPNQQPPTNQHPPTAHPRGNKQHPFRSIAQHPPRPDTEGVSLRRDHKPQHRSRRDRLHNRQGPSLRYRHPQKGGPQSIGKSRGGWTTKIHTVAAHDRTAITLSLSPGQAHDAPTGLRTARRRRSPAPEAVLGDGPCP